MGSKESMKAEGFKMDLQKITESSQDFFHKCKVFMEEQTEKLNGYEETIQNLRKKLQDKENAQTDHKSLEEREAKLRLWEEQLFEKERKLNAMQNEGLKEDDIIDLNVGGWKFSTTLNTLRAEQGSLLEKMFSGDYPIKKKNDGTVFIDRNGELFSFVLDYLRGNMAVVNDEETKKRLIKEANYYQLKGMKSILSFEKKLDKLKDECGDEIVDIIEKMIDNKNAILNAISTKIEGQANNCGRVPMELTDLDLEPHIFHNEAGKGGNKGKRTIHSIEMVNKSFDFKVFEQIDFEHDVVFTNCSFYKAKFRYCKFSGTVSFHDCDLVDAEFSCLNFYGNEQVSFDRSDLRGTKFLSMRELGENIRNGKIVFNQVKYGTCAKFNYVDASEEFRRKVSKKY